MQQLSNSRLLFLFIFNTAITVVLASWLLQELDKADNKYNSDSKNGQQIEMASQGQALKGNPAAKDKLTTRQDTTQRNSSDSLNAVSTSDARTKTQEATETGLSFYDILLMMLLSGGLGGTLCNLRGIFMRFRGGENTSFPQYLELPYYIRVFMGAGAGLFVYFVASFLVASITIEYASRNVPFQGMVSFIALAMLAGFGSLEFFQRVKETAVTLFGQKPEKSKWERIQELHSMLGMNLLTEEEFQAEKKKIRDE